MTRDELLFHQRRLSALGRHVEAIELAEADAVWRAEQSRLRVERKCQKAVAAALFDQAIERSTVDASPGVEQSTPMQADAPTYGPARTMFLAQAGLRQAGLSPREVVVALAILDFHNGKTGRCCAGYEKIAEKAGLGTDKAAIRAVRRAVARLDSPRPRTSSPKPGARLEKPGLGLILTVRHGGIGHANLYLPQWDKLVALAEGARGEVSTASSSPQSTVEPSTGGPQTRVPYQKKVVDRSVRAKQPDRLQRELPLMVSVQGGLSAGDVALRKASHRLMRQLDQHLARFGPREADRVRAALGDDLRAKATMVERDAPGTGFPLLLDGLGPGPPGPMPEVSETLRKKLG